MFTVMLLWGVLFLTVSCVVVAAVDKDYGLHAKSVLFNLYSTSTQNTPKL